MAFLLLVGDAQQFSHVLLQHVAQVLLLDEQDQPGVNSGERAVGLLYARVKAVELGVGQGQQVVAAGLLRCQTSHSVSDSEKASLDARKTLLQGAVDLIQGSELLAAGTLDQATYGIRRDLTSVALEG